MTCRSCGADTHVYRTVKTSRFDTRWRECLNNACRERWETTERETPGTRSRATNGPPQSDVRATNSRLIDANSENSIPNARPPEGSVSLISSSSQADQTRAKSSNDARFWTAHDWKRRFGVAWSNSYNVGHPPGGGDAAAKASGDLTDQLAAMAPDARMAAQVRAGAMFSEFLSDRGPRIVSARHPWSWFVTRFASLTVDAKPAESDDVRRAREAREREAAKSRRDEAAVDAKVAGYRNFLGPLAESKS